MTDQYYGSPWPGGTVSAAPQYGGWPQPGAAPQAPAPQQHAAPPMDANAWLNQQGGMKSVSFAQEGAEMTGVVMEEPTMVPDIDMITKQQKVWDNGEPKYQMRVVVQTQERDPQIANDNGLRALYLSYKRAQAVYTAVKAAGADGIHKGGKIWMKATFVDVNARMQGRKSKPSEFVAQYWPPQAEQDWQAVSGLGGPNGMASAPQPAAMQPAPAAPGPAAAAPQFPPQQGAPWGQPGAPGQWGQPHPAAPQAPAAGPAPAPQLPPQQPPQQGGGAPDMSAVYGQLDDTAIAALKAAGQLPADWQRPGAVTQDTPPF
jgi:hypothetical protein